jgi:hypothetical protein
MGGSFGEVLGPLINFSLLSFGLACFGALCVTMRLVCRVERGLLWRVPLVLLLTAAVIVGLALLERWQMPFVRGNMRVLCASLGFAALWLGVKLLSGTSWLRACVCAGSSVALALALIAGVVVVGASTTARRPPRTGLGETPVDVASG